MALAISDELGLERKSEAAAGMLGACYLGYVLMGHIFLSGSFSHYALIATLPKQYQNISWMDWLLYSLPWGVVVLVGMTAAILFLYAPRQQVALPGNYGREQLRKAGPITKDEKIVLGVLVCALLMWMTESFHHVNSGVVAVTAMCVMLGLGTMTRNDFKNGIDWPAVMLIGSVFNMASVISYLKVDRYLGAQLAPVLDVVIRQPVLLVVFMAVSVYGLKFLLTNMTSMSAMFAMILSPLLVPLGINPWIVIFVTFCAGGIWILSYTNTIYLCAQFGTKGEMATHGSMVKLTFVYMVLIVLGGLVSIPYWKMIGLMP
jgi:DASS family divalent anion:Na+ symporter